jgi:hypothetical protein
MTPRRSLPLLVAALATLAAAGSAHADSYCVAAPDCAAQPDGHVAANLSAAIAAAAAHAGPDRIELGPGTFPAPGSTPTVDSTNDITEIAGAGRDATILTGASNPQSALAVDRPGVVVRDLGFALPDGTNTRGLDLAAAGAVARHVDVEGPAAGGSSQGIGITGGAALEDVRVALATTTPAYGVYVYGGGGATLTDVSITGGYTLRVNSAGTTTVTRARITAGYIGAVAQTGSDLTIADSLVVSTDPSQEAVSATAGGGTSTLRLTRSTIVGRSSGGVVRATQTTASGTAKAILRGVAIAGTGAPLGRTQAGGTAALDVDYSAFAPGTSWGPSDVVGAHNLGAPTGFADAAAGDYRPLWTSPLVDAGDPAAPPAGATDLDGGARAVDGKGDGGEQPDIGAFEYQRRPPVFDAAASATTAPIGSPLSFLVSGLSDPDPGEVPTVRWDFADGTSVAGPTAQRTFTAPGSTTATAVATDPAGVTTTKAITIAVTAAAGGPGSPAGGTPPATSAPGRSRLRVARLRLGRDGRLRVRVSCDGPQACSGKVVLRAGKGRHRVTLATARFRLRAGAARTLALRPGTAARRALAAGRRVRVVATATGRDGLGRPLAAATTGAAVRR